MAGYGRPLKGKTRRVPITVHAAIGLLDIIDEHVEEIKQQQTSSYSRSDFYDEAIKLYLDHLGKLPEESKKNKRNKSVTEKPGDRNNRNNQRNINNKNGTNQAKIT